jgi:hypothetical protein
MAPSLTRGQVCNLLLLLDLASVVPLGSESAGLNTIFYCPNICDCPQTWRARFPHEQGGCVDEKKPLTFISHTQQDTNTQD